MVELSKVPMVQIGKRQVRAYDPGLLLTVLERVANGETLKAISMEPGMPAQETVRQWVIMNPEARQAYMAARELSAESFEEEALNMGREIAKNPGTSQKVRAYEVAMNQLRWSAGRRDPRKFGEQRQTQVVVPVQITTSLNMGAASVGTGTEDHPNIYALEATVVQPVEGEFTPISPPPEEQLPLPSKKAEAPLKRTPGQQARFDAMIARRAKKKEKPDA